MYGFFDTDQKKQRGSRLKEYDAIRSQSPNGAKMTRIDQKYGGVAKDD
jgi:hypothetical protein